MIHLSYIRYGYAYENNYYDTYFYSKFLEYQIMNIFDYFRLYDDIVVKLPIVVMYGDQEEFVEVHTNIQII